MFDLLTIGDCTVDTYALIDPNCPQTHLAHNKKLLCLNYGDKISVFEAGVAVGGNAANVAVGAARLGLKTGIISELGADLNGEFILKTLKKEGVDTSLTEIKKRNKTRTSMVLNYRGERTILGYHSPIKYSLPSLPNTQWVYFTSLGKGFESIQKKLLNYLKKHPETKLAVNPGSYQMKQGLSHFKNILPASHVLFLNKEEAQTLVGKKLPPKQLVSSLHKLGPKIIVITDGAHGSFASENGTLYSLPVYIVQNISKTGAGDAYASAFLSALFYKKSISEAMKWGNAQSSSVIGHIGAQTGLVTSKKVSHIIKKFSKIVPNRIFG